MYFAKHLVLKNQQAWLNRLTHHYHLTIDRHQRLKTHLTPAPNHQAQQCLSLIQSEHLTHLLV